MPTNLPERVKDESTNSSAQNLSAILVWVFLFFMFYLIGSFGVSIGKRTVGDCGIKWKIERVFNGEWFCPEGKKNASK